jgi:hypothetical protein
VFQDLDALEELSKEVDSLDIQKQKRFQLLSKKYDMNNSLVKELIKVRDDLRDKLPIWHLVQKTYSNLDKDKRLGETLRRYKVGTLGSEETRLLDERLSLETKNKILNAEGQLSYNTKLAIRSELLNEAKYPSPHALRHIWAEAVLRRYRGDVGKYIRANFKHLDERFFVAYLRNKETKALYQVATRNVINAVVSNQINSMRDSRRPYAGAFDRYLSKAVRATRVVTIEERENLASKISTQKIISMKGNPWATCILRKGTENQAKCSKEGVPLPYNSSPSLCLGCINGDVAEGNFHGIVIYVKYDIKVCLNKNLPWVIKEPHYRTLTLALKRILELRENDKNSRYDKFIAYLTQTIESTRKERGNDD